MENHSMNDLGEGKEDTLIMTFLNDAWLGNYPFVVQTNAAARAHEIV